MNGPRQYTTFFVGHYHFAIDVEHAQEVVQPMIATPVPLTSDVVTGLVNLRGQIITAVDMRARLELPPGADQDTAVEQAMAVENVQRHLEGKTVRKVIHIPDRLLNIVVG